MREDEVNDLDVTLTGVIEAVVGVFFCRGRGSDIVGAAFEEREDEAISRWDVSFQK